MLEEFVVREPKSSESELNKNERMERVLERQRRIISEHKPRRGGGVGVNRPFLRFMMVM